jgi:hypothetical protein
MKKIILYILSKFLSDDNFRYKVCKEIHNYHVNYFSDQTTPGRFYDACEEFFLASEVVQWNITKRKKHYLEMLYRGVKDTFRKRVLLDDPEVDYAIKSSKSLFHRPKQINKIINFK